MFDNPGGKIKTAAVVMFVISTIGSIVGGIVLLSNKAAAIGVVVMLLGPVISWLSGLFVYGFGQLIENTDEIGNDNRSANKDLPKAVKEKKTTAAVKSAKREVSNKVDKTIAKVAVSDDEYIDIVCPNCAETLSYQKEYLDGNVSVVCPMCGEEFHLEQSEA